MFYNYFLFSLYEHFKHKQTDEGLIKIVAALKRETTNSEKT